MVIIRLRDIQELIDESVRINQNMLDLLSIAVAKTKTVEDELLTLLRQQSTHLTIKEICGRISLDSMTFSDLIHLLEFEKVQIPRYKTKVKQLLGNRRRAKLLVGYANRLQQTRGIGQSIYWMNRQQTSDLFYTMRTNDFSGLGFPIATAIQKAVDNIEQK